MKDQHFETVLALLEENNISGLQQMFRELHEADIAAILNELPSDAMRRLFRLLDEELASEVLPELNDDVLDDVLDHIQENRLVKILDEMDSDEATDIVAELDAQRSEKVLASLENLDREDSDEIRQLLAYDEETAGGIMQTEIIAVEQHLHRDVIIEHIRENLDEVDNLHYVFVTDNENKLIGVLEITRLLLAKQNRSALELMDDGVISAHVNTDQEEVANIFRKYDIYILPIVDDENHLLGRITVDDVIDVIDEEASEDAYKMVGLEREDRVFTSPLSSVGKRLPWLTLNLFTALLVSSVVGIFEHTIAQLSFLAVLMPIVAGLGGNSGTQTLTVITRGIAMGELTLRNTYRAILKEITVGVVNGLIVGSSAMLIAYLLKGDIMLGVVLGCAMVVNMFIAGLFGSIIPVIMKAVRIDPALASSVMITMLTDIGGYASFLGLATLLLL
jgi:magnesium transporter